jgi:hypothetical protein
MNAGETHRFMPFIKHLKARTRDGLAVVIVDGDTPSAHRATRAMAIPVAPGATAQKPSTEHRTRFLAAMDEARRAAVGRPWESALNATKFHFDYFCSERWPGLIGGYHHWTRLWAETWPRAVLVSSLYDAEAQLPALAARDLGIDTFSIPHGGSQMVDDLIAAEKVLCGYELQRKVWQMGGIPDARLVHCRGVVAADEYPAKAYATAPTKDRLRILVLLDPVAAFDQRMLPRVSLQSQLEALGVLSNPPDEMARSVSVRIKTHPNHPEPELFRCCRPTMESMVLPPNHSLDDALSSTDLVVTLNYVGSAFIHAHLTGKPVVHFWNDPLVGETGLVSVGPLISAGGLLVSRVDRLWDEIRKLGEDPTALQALGRRSREYAAAYLDDGGFPEIQELLPTAQGTQPAIDSEKLIETS